MASTRDVIAPPIFAEDASTTIPPTPIAGVSYRDPTAGPASSPDGWPYSQIVNSAEWNQLMFQWSSLLSIMDLKGILGWSSLKDYTERAITFGSDGNIYVWLQESGPGTVAGLKDPVSEPTYWQPLSDYVGANDTLNAPIATVAAAGTINLTTGAPDTSQLEISGTGVSINGFTVAANRAFLWKFDGSNTLINSSSLVTDSGADIQTAPGDSCWARSTSANTVEILCYVRSAVGQVMHVQDRKAAGTGGGTFTSGADRTRDFNTVIKNTIPGASLSSKQITLPAGTYRIQATCAAYAVGQTRAKIVNVSGPVDLLYGPNNRANNDTGVYAEVSGEITLPASTTIELRHRCTVTTATIGFGRDCNFGSEQEVYSDIFIERISR